MKAIKRIIYLMICLIMIVTAIPTMSYAAIEDFTDIPDNWSKPGLLKAIENGLLTGYNGKIMPDDFLTRAEMAAILNKSFGATKLASLEGYTDVGTSMWYYKDMAIALEMGSFVGSDMRMRPENFITREEVFTVIAKVLDLSEGDAKHTLKFSDHGDISIWAKPLLASMIENNYARGSYGKLYPKNNMTRAEFAALMNNLIENYIRVAGTYTGDYAGSLMVSAKDVLLKDMVIYGDLIIGDGVGDGEVNLENVTVMGRTIVRGLAQLVDAGLEIEDEEVALGAAIPQGGNDGGDPTPPPPPPTSSVYGFRMIKEVGAQTTIVLVDELTFRDNDRVNFQMVSDVYDRGNADFIAALNTHTDFIERALKLNSARSSKPYAYTLAQRVLNYAGETSLSVLNTPSIYDIFEEIDANGDENATADQVKAMVDSLLTFSLSDIVSDFKLIYPNSDDFVPEDFSIWTYNGSTLVKQDQLLIQDIKAKMDDIYSAYTIQQLAGKRVMMVEFGDEQVYLEIVVFN